MLSERYMKEILDKYMKQLLRIAFSYVKNTEDAEDVVEDVLVKFVKKGEEFDNEEYEKAWLIRVTINQAKDYLRASKRRDVELEENWNGNNGIEESEVISEILDLPEKYKAPIYLHYVEGYSIHEIGGILKKKDATVGTLLARGRKLLKASIMEV